MSHTPHKAFVLTTYARSLIKIKAAQLCKRRDFQGVDPEDLQQEFLLALVKASAHFDPKRASPNTFACQVINSETAMLIRSRRARSRGNGRAVVSLDQEIASAGRTSYTLGQLVSARDVERRTGSPAVDRVEQAHTAEAVQWALSQMPSELREVCRLLMCGTVASTARKMGVSRRRVQKQIEKIRHFLEKSGLGPT
ncbi:MAG: hypothetical protein KatS3mg109_0664 [Pirellulaceae bacterium]|nr:MAG: hypothetical protein KatS3mg109_0664 [Pirellulaceae bacterium]